MRAIVTIKMPSEGCRNCPFKVEKLVIDRCAVTNSKIDDFVYRRTRADNCPLREVPEEKNALLGTDETPIEVLGLPTRAYNCLKRGNINTVEMLIKVLEECDGGRTLTQIRGMGRGTLEMIRTHLEEYEHGY